MSKSRTVKVKAALGKIKQAIEVRAEITALYEQYRALQEAAQFSAQINPRDFKRAVDAIYYLGGGWPSANSKGRMEALLDNFVGMYRVLDFIGRGHLVHEHLAQYGMKVTMNPEFTIDNRPVTSTDMSYLNRVYNTEVFGIENCKDLRDLVSQLVGACEMLQADICRLADTIKDGLRPEAQRELGVEDEEYDRLHAIVKFSVGNNPKKVDGVKVDAVKSISAYNEALGYISSVVTS